MRGSDLSRFPHGVEQGIRLHRYLDRYTDTHPALAGVRESMPDVPRRFAGIVMDVMFDHHLARRWEQVSALSLDGHACFVHDALTRHEAHFPQPLKRFMRILDNESILQKNVHLESIELTLARIASRSEKFHVLALGVEQLEPLRESLTEPFNAFYPDLHQAALLHVENYAEPSAIKPHASSSQ